MMDILIKNATIVTVNKKREVFFDGALAIKDDRIVGVGPTEEVLKEYGDAKKIIDAEGKVIFPGFINTHNHLFQTLLKGLGDDMVLKDWLATMTFPAAKFITREDTYYAAMQGCIEGLRSGITTMVDYMYPHNRENLSDGIIDAFRELGIRGILGRGCMNTGTQFGVPTEIMQDVETVEKDVRRLFEEHHNSENGRIKIWVAPAAMWSNTKEMLQMLWKVTNEYNSHFTVHISETPFDREATEELHGKVDIELLEELGIVGPNVVMVHCVYLTEEDMELTKKYDMKVSHNTASNMYLSSGVAPVPQMLKKGITVSLGVDGAASNNSQDMIELMKLTALQHKVANLDPLAISAEKVLELATIDGARAVGMEDEIGSLEVGKKADLVIFNPLLNPKAIPLHNPVSTLVYSSSMQNIEGVIVDGNIIMEDSKILTVEDEKSVLKKVQEIADNLCERGEITNKGPGHKWNSLY
ncbi:amidohydrolase [Tissierella sp. MB52-C2]|uniref:amidohydrolase family protein n=1 Tax=Tissierella sp. MB52-C2 TaxID=3070999 RepID=UPI00280C33E3|nr:amidohydrolase [Tissierella sp. MB52-C2]WMM25036.1 amidohydrolase [Tissierella sp. MB52-C2]